MDYAPPNNGAVDAGAPPKLGAPPRVGVGADVVGANNGGLAPNKLGVDILITN